MKNLNSILLDDRLSPETKVYMIANELRKEGQIQSTLWYAILDLKEKHFKEILEEKATGFGEEINR